ncbi:hypothetical protein CRG98_017239 [Punica granatum]|uniref:C2 domain-containing protein n=1 Tax=Punica granatum TaxID=22663 RepID=A0A2I0K2T9_PUNGR|nr:hypothetical protein CRG98_017239 [Punica granatum]
MTTKLVVEVVDASDLMPKDGQGSASPYVEVEFDGQRQRTHTKPRDLNPQWNQKLFFNVNGGPTDLHHRIIDVVVYNDRNHGHHKNFLGRVRISGHSVPFSDSEASVQRYPLDKRGLFSHIRGDISLKIYLLNVPHEYDEYGPSSFPNFRPPPQNANTADADAAAAATTTPTILQDMDFNHDKLVNEGRGHIHAHADDDQYTTSDNYNNSNKKNNTKEEITKQEKDAARRTFHSIGTNSSGGTGRPSPSPAPPPPFSAPPGLDAHFMKAGPGPTSVVRMQAPKLTQNPEFSVVETRPPVAAHLRYRGGDKTTSTYDLVEQMHFLYVSVVKAKDLPNMDVSGSLDPYVEVKVGNYKGITKHLEKNQNPVWNQIFAFSKEKLQSNFLEVTVKDKDIGLDDFVGKVTFDITEVPLRVPPDSPLAPQWYKLKNKKGESTTTMKGEIMLAVWMGTQADESFPTAWHSDAHTVTHANLSNTRSKVYFSPKLYYLRVHVIEAQDLIPHERGRAPDAYVKVQLGNQGRVSRPSQIKTTNPIWNDELMFVAPEPFEDSIIVSVEDRVGPGKDEPLGRLLIPVRDVPHRVETAKLPDPRWFNLHRPTFLAEDEEKKKKEVKFASKICLRLWLDVGYHVLDESTHLSSDLQPSSKHLRKASIGILELGILSARNLLPMKSKEGRTTDAYCVAKYGNKWVRTRTLLDTLTPRWNEQYTWEVFDPCTVITVGVFDNCHINGKDDARDQRIGKVRIRLSTLEIHRVYTHYYPLLVLQSSGLKKNGELQLALRFTCTAWVNMVARYGRPLLPKMHYIHPIPVRYIDWLRHQAMQIVAARLTRAEPPLRREVVEYMLDVDHHMFSLRRSKANFHRIMSVLSGATAVCRWLDGICQWKNPVTTCLVHILFLILVCYPELILPTIFLYLFMIGIWNYRFRQRHPPHMDARLSQAEFAHPDELDEEFDTFPTTRPTDIVRMRYDRLRSVAGRVQTVIGDLATQGERTQAILSWRDPRATAIFIIFSLILAVLIYITPPQVVAVLLGLYWLRHPRFRRKLPSVPVRKE